MITGIFITARLGSTRLSHKHLINAGGKMFIQWLTERFQFAFRSEIDKGEVKIFVVTSTDPENTKFEEVFADSGISVFYGSDKNIPLRHLECAVANQIDYILSVDGDDILCSTHAGRLVKKALEEGAEMAQTKGLPLGMNMTGYSVSFLKKSVEQYSNSVLETGWGRIFDSEKIGTIPYSDFEQGEMLRMTLDYEDDALFFKEVISTVGSDIIQISDLELIDIILENDLGKLNEGLNEEYWINFNKQKRSEQ